MKRGGVHNPGNRLEGEKAVGGVLWKLGSIKTDQPSTSRYVELLSI